MLTLRLARGEDAAQILAIYAPYVAQTTVSFEWEVPSMEVFSARCASIMAHYPYIVACEGEKVVGYCYASRAFERYSWSWDCDISIYLDPAYHKRGIGRALCNCLCDLAALQGYRNMYALIAGENKNSLAFHKACGFTQAGVLEKGGYKMNRWIDVHWCTRVLQAPGAPEQAPVPLSQVDAAQVAAVLRRHSEALA